MSRAIQFRSSSADTDPGHLLRSFQSVDSVRCICVRAVWLPRRLLKDPERCASKRHRLDCVNSMTDHCVCCSGAVTQLPRR